MKAILAADSPRLNELFALHLVEEGVEPSKAESTSEIKSAINSKGIDTLLIDIDSTIYQGLETLKELREQFNDLQIIVFTSQTGVDFVKEINEIGVFGLISKIDEMKTQLNNINILLDNLKRRKDEFRRHIRVQPSLSQHNVFTLKIKGLESEYQGQVKDISRGGVAITFSNPPPDSLLFKGKEVSMNIELGAVTLKVRGLVVVRAGMDTALLFHDMADTFKKRLFEYVLTQLDV
ncbi:MAG: hypothetical protein IEMM0008_1926 [bacterium]|nr:MAG: hypothetical protein IEMM0008_1926 [bacterium]